MPPKTSPPGGPDAVEALLAGLGHPHEQDIRALRALILAASPRVTESVKWNAPSFATTEHFATFHLRAKAGVQLILHFGAKKRDRAVAIEDPHGLLEWLAEDRATVKFRDGAEIDAKRDAFTTLIRAWIAAV